MTTIPIKIEDYCIFKEVLFSALTYFGNHALLPHQVLTNSYIKTIRK